MALFISIGTRIILLQRQNFLLPRPDKSDFDRTPILSGLRDVPRETKRATLFFVV